MSVDGEGKQSSHTDTDRHLCVVELYCECWCKWWCTGQSRWPTVRNNCLQCTVT